MILKLCSKICMYIYVQVLDAHVRVWCRRVERLHPTGFWRPRAQEDLELVRGCRQQLVHGTGLATKTICFKQFALTLKGLELCITPCFRNCREIRTLVRWASLGSKVPGHSQWKLINLDSVFLKSPHFLPISLIVKGQQKKLWKRWPELIWDRCQLHTSGPPFTSFSKGWQAGTAWGTLLSTTSHSHPESAQVSFYP